jgi:hypothetical protein
MFLKSLKIASTLLKDEHGNIFSIHSMYGFENDPDVQHYVRTARENGLNIVFGFIPWVSPDTNDIDLDMILGRWLPEADASRNPVELMDHISATTGHYHALRQTPEGQRRILVHINNFNNIDQVYLNPYDQRVQEYYADRMKAMIDLVVDAGMDQVGVRVDWVIWLLNRNIHDDVAVHYVDDFNDDARQFYQSRSASPLTEPLVHYFEVCRRVCLSTGLKKFVMYSETYMPDDLSRLAEIGDAIKAQLPRPSVFELSAYESDYRKALEGLVSGFEPMTRLQNVLENYVLGRLMMTENFDEVPMTRMARGDYPLRAQFDLFDRELATKGKRSRLLVKAFRRMLRIMGRMSGYATMVDQREVTGIDGHDGTLVSPPGGMNSESKSRDMNHPPPTIEQIVQRPDFPALKSLIQEGLDHYGHFYRRITQHSRRAPFFVGSDNNPFGLGYVDPMSYRSFLNRAWLHPGALSDRFYLYTINPNTEFETGATMKVPVWLQDTMDAFTTETSRTVSDGDQKRLVEFSDNGSRLSVIIPQDEADYLLIVDFQWSAQRIVRYAEQVLKDFEPIQWAHQLYDLYRKRQTRTSEAFHGYFVEALQLILEDRDPDMFYRPDIWEGVAWILRKPEFLGPLPDHIQSRVRATHPEWPDDDMTLLKNFQVSSQRSGYCVSLYHE